MLTLKNIQFTYAGSRESVLNGIDLQISDGEVVLILGPNGSGKSTLLKTITGLVPKIVRGKFQGEVCVNGKSISNTPVNRISTTVGTVLQDPESQITNVSVIEEIAFGMGNNKLPKSEMLQKAELWLRNIGLTDKRNAIAYHLSGGQKQRLALASMLCMEPSVVVMDEPTAHLDPEGTMSLVEAIKTTLKYANTFVIATHVIEPFMSIATRIIVMDGGQIVADFKASDLYNHLDTLDKYDILRPSKFESRDKVVKNPRRVSKVQISTNNASFGYDAMFSLKDITVEVAEGDWIGIIGPNGAGKSTLVRLLAGLRKPVSGKVYRNTSKLALLVQEPAIGFIGQTVLEEIGLKNKEWLRRFGLERYSAVSPHTLSGGEQRRLAVAVALAEKPDVVFLDEPTAGMDNAYVTTLLSLLEDFGGTIVQITHDPRIVRRSHRIWEVRNGRVV